MIHTRYNNVTIKYRTATICMNVSLHDNKEHDNNPIVVSSAPRENNNSLSIVMTLPDDAHFPRDSLTLVKYI